MTMTRRLLLTAGFGLLLAANALAQTRTLGTTFGDVEIPLDPQRIVTTHYIATQPLVELGVVPVGQGQISAENTPFWAELQDVPFVAQGTEINLEQIAALRPDLILCINLVDEQQLAQLRSVAPVLVIGIRGADRSDWQHRVEQIADAINKRPQYEALAKALAERQARIKAEHADTLREQRFAVFTVSTPGEPTLFTAGSMTGQVLSGAGAQYAPGGEALALPDAADVKLSEETIGDILADATTVLYNTNLDGSDNPAMAQFKQSAVYAAIPAVAAGQAFPLGKPTVAGFADANILLDNFEQVLAQLAAP